MSSNANKFISIRLLLLLIYRLFVFPQPVYDKMFIGSKIIYHVGYVITHDESYFNLPFNLVMLVSLSKGHKQFSNSVSIWLILLQFWQGCGTSLVNIKYFLLMHRFHLIFLWHDTQLYTFLLQTLIKPDPQWHHCFYKPVWSTI